MRTQRHSPYWRHLRKLPYRCGHAGITLLEVVIALFLMGILSAIFGMGLVGAVQSYEFSRTNTHIAQKAQLAMTRMSRELMELSRIIAVSTGENDPFIIYERLEQGNTTALARFGIHHHRGADGNTIRLYTHLDTNVAALDGSTIDQGDVLIDGVDTFSLEFYLGEDRWLLPTTVPDIQLLSIIDITMTLARTDKPGTSQDFQTRIHLRNTQNFGGANPTLTPVSSGDYSCFISTLPGDFAL